jgi:ELWxxDGT repeat protein
MMYALVSAPTTRRIGVGLSVLLLLALAITHLWHPVQSADSDPPATVSANGTLTLVKDIFPGLSPSSPQDLTNMNGTLFFTADDGAHGKELWKSDGTTTGTTMVADINPGRSQSLPVGLTDMNGTLFFSISNDTNGRELWKSDGTTTGTTMVADINPGSADSLPTELTNMNRTLFFTADDGAHGTELWKYTSQHAIGTGIISGTITDKDGLPLENIHVFAYGDASFVSATTDSDGTYTLNELATGSYQVRFVDVHGTYMYEYYDNAATLADATEVIVAADQRTDGIDAVLDVAPPLIEVETVGGVSVNPVTGEVTIQFQRSRPADFTITHEATRGTVGYIISQGQPTLPGWPGRGVRPGGRDNPQAEAEEEITRDRPRPAV